jgi:COMPASS component SWD2
MDFHSKATNYLVTASDDESIRLYDTQNAVCAKHYCVFRSIYYK